MYNIRARQAERHTGICTSTMSYKSFWPALGISCTTACLQTGESPYRKTIGLKKNYYVIIKRINVLEYRPRFHVKRSGEIEIYAKNVDFIYPVRLQADVSTVPRAALRDPR